MQLNFLENIDPKAAVKLVYNISKAQQITDVRVFKKLKNSNIWEFRAEYGSNEYRLFAFWNIKQNTFVVCTHGILKKTQKTPQKEIDKAEQIRKQFLGL
jgi:phage-related protein